MLTALSYSDNIYAMKTHLFLGMDNLSKMGKRLKISTPIKENASSALGTTEINMIDYSNAFITLANEGEHTTPHIIEKITDNNDRVYIFKPTISKSELGSPFIFFNSLKIASL